MSDLREASPLLASDLEKGLVGLDRRDLVEQVLETTRRDRLMGGFVYDAMDIQQNSASSIKLCRAT